jgi:hypothetical protein
MADENVASTEIGYLGLPVGDIIDCSNFQQNEVARCPAILRLSDVEWTAKNQAAIFQAYDGLVSGFTKYVADTKQDSKKAAFSTVTKNADPYLLPLGFGAFCLDDIISSPEKYTAMTNDVAACLAELIEVLALTEFAKPAVKTAVDNSTLGLSLNMFIDACKNFGKFQRRNKSAIVHPDVFAKIKSLAGTYNVAGTDATIISGEIAKFAGCTLFQSNHCDQAEGVYTTYISLDSAYQYGLPQDIDMREKTERGKLERYIDVSLAYVDYTPKAIGGVKRVVELKHLLEATP